MLRICVVLSSYATSSVAVDATIWALLFSTIASVMISVYCLTTAAMTTPRAVTRGCHS